MIYLIPFFLLYKFDDSHGPGKPPFSVEVGVSSVIRALDEGEIFPLHLWLLLVLVVEFIRSSYRRHAHIIRGKSGYYRHRRICKKSIVPGILARSSNADTKICVDTFQGYGGRGFPPVIPANATLRLEVRLLRIN